MNSPNIFFREEVEKKFYDFSLVCRNSDKETLTPVKASVTGETWAKGFHTLSLDDTATLGRAIRQLILFDTVTIKTLLSDIVK